MEVCLFWKKRNKFNEIIVEIHLCNDATAIWRNNSRNEAKPRKMSESDLSMNEIDFFALSIFTELLQFRD